MLTIFKRFEIWVLLILVAAAIWWALRADPDPVSSGYSKDTTNSNTATANVDGSGAKTTSLLELKNINYSPELDKGNGLLEVTLMGRSGTANEVVLTEENVELLTSEGEPVRRFFMPFSSDPMLQPHEPSLVTLKFWVTKPVDVLWLTYREQTIKVVLPSV